MGLLRYYSGAFRHLVQAWTNVKSEDGISKFNYYISAFYCWIRYGVTPNEFISWQFYKYNHIIRRTFYTARHTKKFEKAYNAPSFACYFDNKVKFNSKFNDFIGRKWLCCANADLEEVKSFLVNCGKCIVKPVNSSGGRGIFTWDIEEQKNCEELLGKDILLEETISQHEELSKLNEGSSVNSIRVYTVVDKNGEVYFLSASLRVGAVGSITDNFHTGGVAYPIDLASGVIYMPGIDRMGTQSYIFHPNTNCQVVGFMIPRWLELKKFVSCAAVLIPESRLIAWDVAITPTGFELIEGNYAGNPNIMQATCKIGKLKDIKKYV